jgi:predicted MFS family arabinose efflux permease
MADDFGVTGERASLVPTLLQCGYACGLLFIIPIGDIARRRPLIIGLIFVTSLLVSAEDRSTPQHNTH